MNEVLNIILSNVFEIIIGVLSIVVVKYILPLIQTELKPWLEEKRIYSLAKKFVEAAEKLAATGKIKKCDKKEYVLKLLEKNGIVVNDTISAFVESAVQQLDIVIDTVKNELKEEGK